MDTVFVKYVDELNGKTFRTSKRELPRGTALSCEDEKMYIEDRVGRAVAGLDIRGLSLSESKEYYRARVTVRFEDGVDVCCGRAKSGACCKAYPRVLVRGRAFCHRHKPIKSRFAHRAAKPASGARPSHASVPRPN